jgi:FkbM family methyltransferase
MPQHVVFSQFEACNVTAPDGLFVDWLGERIPGALVEAHLFGERSASGGDRTNMCRPRGYFPPFNEEYFEWIDLLESALQASGVFTFLELGAGYGRWSVRAACAARQLGKRYQLGLAEAAPKHVSEIHEVMAINGVSRSDYTIFECAVAKERGEGVFVVEWPTGNPPVWYGQALTRNSMSGAVIAGEHKGVPLWRMSDGWGVIKIEQRPLSGIIAGYSRIDLADFDLQGMEAEAIDEALSMLTDRVRRLHIGTHSHEIEARLREMLSGAGWTCARDYPCLQENDTPFGRIPFVDGVQTWINEPLSR